MPSDLPSKETKPSYIPYKAQDAALKRQNYRCDRCNKHFISTTSPMKMYAKFRKSRAEGWGYHSKKRVSTEDGFSWGPEDFGNIYIVCEPCNEELTSTVTKTLRIHKSKYALYEKWMEDNPNAPKNFNALGNLALENLTDSPYFEQSIIFYEMEKERYRGYAEKFLELLEMYNSRNQDDIAFVQEISTFFRYYEPERKMTDDEIDSSSDNAGIREFLKEVRDQEIKIILSNKSNGWGNYCVDDEEGLPDHLE